ncbi:hypothetical protein PUNSTDRAFT_136129 [Punctularia strigosozonata HHB-11173 SS5]|uniref:uncharacterized protein n=1 Tax=Punctularia strigosozonata (strain HHB-11173) TaxID=741275 RepID=UPI0004417B90|nr:uncharacterized protein PUNSTDRAFT_136129 [Punctularia strigosozonata HHB-11173 SS5]EIN07446.1 hypothetical protein PUNSTDRAFT_136129 [Punctularia strigosozonata HHB-11173 SS5]
MVKKSRTKAALISGPTPKPAPPLTFPDLTPKMELERTVLVDDQIILLDGLFDAEECKRYVKFIDELPLELTPPPKRGEAERVNHRISASSPSFAEKLYAILAPHLPEEFPYPSSARRPAGKTHHSPHSLNSNIRMYKYTPEQYFGPHYDDSVRDAVTAAKSEWTLLIYLTGEEDGVEGGETLFYHESRGKPRETITPPLRRGMALLHRRVQV